jgi:hypothetical protein
VALKIIEKRARLLGLFPKEGAQQTLGVAVRVGSDGGELSALQIEFVSPKSDRDVWRIPERQLRPRRGLGRRR